MEAASPEKLASSRSTNTIFSLKILIKKKKVKGFVWCKTLLCQIGFVLHVPKVEFSAMTILWDEQCVVWKMWNTEHKNVVGRLAACLHCNAFWEHSESGLLRSTVRGMAAKNSETCFHTNCARKASLCLKIIIWILKRIQMCNGSCSQPKLEQSRVMNCIEGQLLWCLWSAVAAFG